jgi:ribA/ribD-fused uncharacterized protein
MNLEQRLEHDGAVDPILFYSEKNAWGVFSNFSHHPVVLPHPWTAEPTRYHTSEHRYQAMKAMNPSDHDWVAGIGEPDISAGVSKTRGGPRGIKLRPDWGDKYQSVCYYVMLEVVTAKALQNGEMQDALADSEGRTLYEDSPTDDIWGIRNHYDYRGRNLLGQALMEVRYLLYGYPPTRPFYL